MAVGTRFIRFEATEILYTDIRDCAPEIGIEILRQASELVRQRPLDSVLSLIDATDANYDRESVAALKELAAGNRPYIRAAAVVGVTGLRRIILQGLTRFSKRSFELFDDVESARRFLATARDRSAVETGGEG